MIVFGKSRVRSYAELMADEEQSFELVHSPDGWEYSESVRLN